MYLHQLPDRHLELLDLAPLKCVVVGEVDVHLVVNTLQEHVVALLERQFALLQPPHLILEVSHPALEVRILLPQLRGLNL